MKKTFILSENTYDITHSNCYNLYVDEQTYKQIAEYLVARVNWPFKDGWTAESKRYSAKN